jgi:uncharacterized protein YfiM (DUF2279 family)
MVWFTPVYDMRHAMASKRGAKHDRSTAVGLAARTTLGDGAGSLLSQAPWQTVNS